MTILSAGWEGGILKSAGFDLFRENKGKKCKESLFFAFSALKDQEKIKQGF